jgi:hypothetical protein
MYGPGASGALEASAIHVLEWHGSRITMLHAFLEPSLFEVFGLPTRTSLRN